MPKGKPPVIAALVDTKAFLAEREEASKRNHVKLTGAKKDQNYRYLKSLFEAMVSNHESSGIIKDEYPKGAGRLRYTPGKMFDCAVTYMRITIDESQPLTITGLGMFMGLHRKDFFNILNEFRLKTFPEYSFIYDMADFVEMYNEYAAHQKQNPAGPIFILKNFGWKDKFEIEASSTQGALTDAEREIAQQRLAQFSEDRVVLK